jgi:undecaprenyl-diphosphatase
MASSLSPSEVDGVARRETLPTPPAASRPRHTRSPVYVFDLVVGGLVAICGWAVATLLEHGIVATSQDLASTLGALPDWMGSGPGVFATLGLVAGFLGINVWLLADRRYRRLGLVYASLVAGLGLSILASALLMALFQPGVRAVFEHLPSNSPRLLPTDPVVAGFIAVVVMCRRWLPSRIRPMAVAALVLWLASNFALADAPPYLGLLLDLGLGMIGGSVVALAFGTPNLQPDRQALLVGLSRSGLDVSDLWSADVDARGSEPWRGVATDGTKVFVKALSGDQRAADLLFRAVRWVRLRRAGDAAPEVSLQRAAEHEALVSHHVRSFGLPTPRVLAVAEISGDNVALAYEAIDGRSFDKVSVDLLTDAVVAEVWRHVMVLRAHAVAHRDLRLANVFLADDGGVLLIDFGFAELAAHPQLLDTDVAELLAATAAALGTERAVRVALGVVGVDVLESARNWLHPLALSRATRAALGPAERLDELRAEVARRTGHTIAEYEPLGRFATQRVLGLGLLGLGVYSLFTVFLDKEVAEEFGQVRWGLASLAFVVSLLVVPLGAAAYRSATKGRVSLRSAMRALLASEAPVRRPTYWSWANRVLSDAARGEGLQAVEARAAASRWTVGALLVSPLMVAGFTAAALQNDRGYLVGLGIGLLAGGALAATELLFLRFGPSAHELDRVWLRPHHALFERSSGVFTEVWWWALVRSAQGVAFVLAARSAGVTMGIEGLLAIAIASYAIASLTPAPGDLGAAELLLYAGLAIGTDSGVAGLAVVVTRTVSFWMHLPFAAVAYRSTRRYKQRIRP